MEAACFDIFITYFFMFNRIALRMAKTLWSFLSAIGLTLIVPEIETFEFANSIDLNEVAHSESPHLDLHQFLYSLTLLHSERPKLYLILAFLSAIRLNSHYATA